MNLRRKALSMLLSAAMILNMGVPVFAAEATTDVPIGASSVCEHHTEHDEACGYSEGEAGSPCAHAHTAACYTDELLCTLEETAEATATDSGTAHQHTQECYALACSHERGEHDETCSYTEGKAGTPCTYKCLICNPADSGNQDGLQEQCSCKALCTEGLKGADCPVCGAEGANLENCKGEAPDLSIGVSSIAITTFDELAQDIKEQSVPAKTPLADLNLPDTLAATGYAVGADTATSVDAVQDSGAVTTPAAITIEGVTWASTPPPPTTARLSAYTYSPQFCQAAILLRQM